MIFSPNLLVLILQYFLFPGPEPPFKLLTTDHETIYDHETWHLFFPLKVNNQVHHFKMILVAGFSITTVFQGHPLCS